MLTKEERRIIRKAMKYVHDKHPPYSCSALYMAGGAWLRSRYADFYEMPNKQVWIESASDQAQLQRVLLLSLFLHLGGDIE